VAKVFGCKDESACNFDADANTDSECEYNNVYYDCSNACISDSDTDGVCDELEVDGCTDSLYTQYEPLATENDGSCATLVVSGCTDDKYKEYGASANTDDGSCSILIIEGCMDNTYLEYNSSANTVDESACETLIVEGCTNPKACNYNSVANVDDNLCLIIPESDVCDRCSGETDGTGTIIYNNVDSDGGCLNIDETQTKGIQIYPNPSRDMISISNVAYETVSIYSLSGQMLQLNKNHDGQINISTLSSGVYTLKLTDAEGNQHYSKLIKK
jgi:hypothetical protein